MYIKRPVYILQGIIFYKIYLEKVNFKYFRSVEPVGTTCEALLFEDAERILAELNNGVHNV